MDFTPLVNAVFMSEDEIEQGFIQALIDSFESESNWPEQVYSSVRGRDLMSDYSWKALSVTLAGAPDLGLSVEEPQKTTVVTESRCKRQVHGKMKPVKRVTAAQMRRMYGVGAKISHYESPTEGD